MLDTVVHHLLFVGLVVTTIVAVRVYQLSDRTSRRISIAVMFPTLIIWAIFEFEVLLPGDHRSVTIWTSRLGRMSLLYTFGYQLWTIGFSDKAEQAEIKEL